MSDQTLNKLTICAVIFFSLLQALGFKGCFGIGAAIGVMRLFAVFGQAASEKEVGP